jgi:hypothetical protein
VSGADTRGVELVLPPFLSGGFGVSLIFPTQLNSIF